MVAQSVEVVGGADLRQPILLTVGTLVPDITGYTLSGEVSWRGRSEIPLVSGSEIVIRYPAPPIVGGEASKPHLDLVLDGDQTNLLPVGRIALVALKALTVAGIIVPFAGFYLQRIR